MCAQVAEYAFTVICLHQRLLRMHDQNFAFFNGITL